MGFKTIFGVQTYIQNGNFLYRLSVTNSHFYVQDFDHFPAHQFTFNDQKYRSLDSSEGAEWKELRKSNNYNYSYGMLYIAIASYTFK